jgi:hypothetical protein
MVSLSQSRLLRFLVAALGQMLMMGGIWVTILITHQREVTIGNNRDTTITSASLPKTLLDF